MFPKSFQKVQKVQKSSKQYYCKLCDYNTSYKSHFEKHILTKKHIQNSSGQVSKWFPKVQKVQNQNLKNNEKLDKFTCIYCSKVYKSKSGLWKHRKKCQKCNFSKNSELNQTNRDEQMFNILINTLKEVNSTTNNIQTQNNISINVFLNEHCKNAMSLQDFVKQINISLKDIKQTKEHGFVNGISNVIIKNLEDLPNTDRPIHSTDIKRSKFVIKGEDGWEKDDGTKVDNAVSQVKIKHITALNKWEKENPEYQNNPDKLKEWQSILNNISSGKDEKECQKNNKLIKKKIAEKFTIKNAIEDLNK